MPTSYNHLTEIDEQNNEEEYRSLSLVEEASRKMGKSRREPEACTTNSKKVRHEQRKRTATTDARQKALKSMMYDEELN